MATLQTLEALLTDFELYDPELGQEFRTSPHILMLGLGRSELSFWEVSPLHYFSDGERVTAFNALAEGLRVPANVRAAITRLAPARDGGGPPGAWQPSILSVSERVERVRLTGPELELRYADRENRYQLRLAAPPLPAERSAAAQAWLAEEETLLTIARGLPLDPAHLAGLDLVPAWETLEATLNTRSPRGLELGIKFVCAALAVYPAYLPIWRGLDGIAALRQFVETRLAHQHQEFEAATIDLPQTPGDFWSEPALPDVPAPHRLTPSLGLGAQLAPPNFWKENRANQLLETALDKVYKNVARKVVKMSTPEHEE